MNNLVQIALAVRAEHTKCQELAKDLRREYSWATMAAIGHQLQTHLESWRELLSTYDRLSKEYEYALPDEVSTHHALNKLVDDYRHIGG